MKKLWHSVLVVLALGIACGWLSVAASNPPQDIDQTLMFPAGTLCPFELEVVLTGKSKPIDLPGDRMIVTGPGLHVTMTNLSDPTKQVTLNITGVAHQTMQQDGSVVVVSTGRSVLFDEFEGVLVLVIGTFSLVIDAAGNQIQPLEGQGQLTDACALIS
jgi:hypothetical protein